MSGKKPFFGLLPVFLLLCSYPLFSQDLSGTQKEMLTKELVGMLNEVRLLKNLQKESSRELKTWKDNCSQLETRLQNALMSLERVSQNLEDSKTAVIELQKLVEELRLQLTELKDEYLSACRSLERQKKAKKFWKGTALGCMILAVIEGMIIIFK